MRSVQGSSRLGNLNARSPRAMIRLLRTAGSTSLAVTNSPDQNLRHHASQWHVGLAFDVAHAGRRAGVRVMPV